ncbi:hypothetical protein HCB37_01850 [Listeria booriae]|nr:hypothetical protein [Listeria booriae]MBC2263248.1 hypothetical protein [Listeria booriae]
MKETGILKHSNIPELVNMIDDYKDYVLNPNNKDYNFHNFDDYLQIHGI